jgi:hypothetical protein
VSLRHGIFADRHGFLIRLPFRFRFAGFSARTPENWDSLAAFGLKPGDLRSRQVRFGSVELCGGVWDLRI